MKVRIHFTYPNGTADYIDLTADTVNEIRELAAAEVKSRQATNPWSEVLEG